MTKLEKRVTKIDKRLKIQVLVKPSGKKYRLIKCPSDSRFKPERIGKCQNTNHDEFDNPSDQQLRLVIDKDASDLCIDELKFRHYWCVDCCNSDADDGC